MHRACVALICFRARAAQVLEVRIQEGFGARWSGGFGGVPLQFRGFLEPMMEGGHEVGWRH
eukprot:1197722-Rhodomonas_salina.2